ncbi:hypothetical protein PAL_GLEAN10004976 [Pteropus alecto]|uniref:Uncharacterized protein n=1 Tax=Pteropus alecto TaxID=9402 RepID=L5KMV7_PTEAL|nr:hypothetical protein PAL_GLEAN10004976 [Pteropus alecto]
MEKIPGLAGVAEHDDTETCQRRLAGSQNSKRTLVATRHPGRPGKDMAPQPAPEATDGVHAFTRLFPEAQGPTACQLPTLSPWGRQPVKRNTSGEIFQGPRGDLDICFPGHDAS